MNDSPIATVELFHVALPPRREHKWTGLTEPIGGYVLVKMIDAAGAVGWGEAPALKDWGGEFGRYFGGESRNNPRGHLAISRASRERLCAGRDRGIACADGPRHQRLPLCQSGGGIRGL